MRPEDANASRLLRLRVCSEMRFMLRRTRASLPWSRSKVKTCEHTPVSTDLERRQGRQMSETDSIPTRSQAPWVAPSQQLAAHLGLDETEPMEVVGYGDQLSVEPGASL